MLSASSDPVLSFLLPPPSSSGGPVLDAVSEDVGYPVTEDGASLAGVLMGDIVRELVKRAALEAEMEEGGDEEGDGRTVVINQEHIMKVAAEVLMDFT